MDDAPSRTSLDVNEIALVADVAAQQVVATPYLFASQPTEKEPSASGIWCRVSDVTVLRDLPSAPRMSTEGLDRLAARHRAKEGW